MIVRQKTADDQVWVRDLLTEHWGGTMVVTHGQRFEVDRLPGLVAEPIRGLATYQISDDGREAELVTLDAAVPGRGVGTALVAGLVELLRRRGVTILRLTTNDNLTALRFYQRRGFLIVGVHPGAMAAARRLKPTIPERGEHGIPIRDEIELELVLSGEGGERGDDHHAYSSRPMMPSDAQDDRLNPPRSLWRRIAQSLFAVLCVVAASLAGGASAGNSTLQIAAAADKATSADPSRDYGRSVLRPDTETTTERTAQRGIDCGGSVPDSGSGAAVPAAQDVVWRPDDEIGVLPSDEHRPDRLTVRAGASRAPPMMSDRFRPFA